MLKLESLSDKQPAADLIQNPDTPAASEVIKLLILLKHSVKMKIFKQENHQDTEARPEETRRTRAVFCACDVGFVGGHKKHRFGASQTKRGLREERIISHQGNCAGC